MSEVAIKFTLNPVLNVGAFNQVISAVKTSLGDLGKDIKPIDEAKFNQAMGTTAASAKQAAGAVAGLTEAEKVLGSQTQKTGNTLATGAFYFNAIYEGTQRIANGLSKVIETGEEYEKALKAVGAFTGTTGEQLEALGSKARILGIRFADIGGAKDQLEIFSAVLSKMGPAYGQNAEAMGKFAENANVLAKAGGMDVKSSVDVMTNSMLQFGLRTGDANKDAETSTRIINGLAASARAGAAQIPQVGEAILQAGVMAKGSKMSFEDTAAAIQIMAVGGKTGAEAGVALRNVLGLMQRPSAEAEASLKKMGLTSTELGDALTKKGFGAAIEYLKGGLKTLSSDTEKNATMMKIFGMENAAAAGIFMDNIDRYKEFQDAIKDGIAGTGTAFEMYEQKSGSASGNIKKMQAAIKDVWISVSTTMGSGFQTVLLASTQVAPMLMSLSTLSPILSKLGGAVGSVAVNILTKLIPSLGATVAANAAAGVSGVAAFTSMAGAVWAAMAPLLPFIAVLGAVGVAAYALAGGFEKSTEAKLKDTEASIQSTEKNIQINQQQQKQELSNINLVKRYEELIQAKKEGKDVDEELNRVMERLNDRYPAAIDLTGKHEDNLRKVKESTGLAGVETKKFTAENQKLVQEYGELGKKERLSNAEKERMKTITNELKQEFPGVIEGAKDFGSGLDVLKLQAGLLNNNIRQLNNELAGFEAESKKLAQIQATQKRDLIKDTLVKDFTTMGVTLSGSTNDAITVVGKFYDELYKISDRSKLPDLSRRYREMLDKIDFGGDDAKKNKFTSAIIQMTQAQITVLESYQEKVKTTAGKTADEVISSYDKIVNEIKNANENIDKNGTAAFKSVTKEIKAMNETIVRDNTAGLLNKQQVDDLNAQIKALKARINVKKDGAGKELKLEEDLLKLQHDLEEKEQLLRAKNIQDSNERELAQLKYQNQKVLNAEAEKIDKLEKQKTDKKLSQKDKDVIDEEIKVLTRGVEVTKQLQASAITDFYQKVGEAEQKRQAELDKKNSDALKSRLESLKAQEPKIQSVNDLMINLQEQAKLSSEIAQTETQDKINSILLQQDAYKKALGDVAKWQMELSLAQKTGMVMPALTASANFTLAKAALDDLAGKIKVTNKEITNLTLAEYEQREVTFKSNLMREYDAIIQFNNNRLAAEANYSSKASWYEAAIYTSAYGSAMAFHDAMSNVDFNDKQIRQEKEAVKKETDDKREALRNQQSDLEESFRKKEISSAEFNRKQAELRNQYNENEKKARESESRSNIDFWSGINKSLATSFQKTATDAFAQADKDAERYTALRQRYAAMDDKLSREAFETHQAMSIAENKMMSEKALGYAAMYAAMGTSTQHWASATVQILFEVAKRELAVYVFKAFAGEVGEKGLLGIIPGAVAAAAVYAAFSAMQAKIGNGFEKGGPVYGGQQMITVNEKGQEFVANAKFTKQHFPMLDYMNRTDITLDKYISTERPDIQKKLVQDAIIEERQQMRVQKEYFEREIYVPKANNSDLINEIKELRKENADMKKVFETEIRKLQKSQFNKIAIELEGEMKADGDDFRGSIKYVKRKALAGL